MPAEAHVFGRCSGLGSTCRPVSSSTKAVVMEILPAIALPGQPVPSTSGDAKDGGSAVRLGRVFVAYIRRHGT